MQKTDEVLIADYQLGNKEAFDELYRRYKVPIFNFSLRILGSRADAEDVTSEVFLTLCVKKDMYRPIAKFKTWLFKVAHNLCMNCFRKQKRKTTFWFTKKDGQGYEEWDVPDDNDGPSELLNKKEEGAAVRNAIRILSENQKSAIILREYHQMNYQQIAEVMDCSVENIKILIYRARIQLKKTLAIN